MEDSKIIDLYWQRSEQAISHTRAKFSRYCYSIAYNILQDPQESEEAENDTYLDAWNSMPPHRPARLSAFLGRITRRIALDRWRSRTAQKRGNGQEPLSLDELKDCIPSATQIDDALHAKELAAYIDRFLRGLPKTERSLFLCRYWYCDSIARIASQFGFSQSKVKTTLHRTRSKLKAYLEKEGIIL